MTLEGYLLVAGAIMTLLVTSRPAMRAVRDYGTDLCKIVKAFRRAVQEGLVAEVVVDVHTLTQRFEEHESDTELHLEPATPAPRHRHFWEDPDA